MSMSEIKVKWQVDDGYAGPARPRQITLHTVDFVDCETEEQVLEVLHEIVEEEFQQRTSWTIRNEKDVIDAWRAAKGKGASNE
jgi:hypothetical protein